MSSIIIIIMITCWLTDTKSWFEGNARFGYITICCSDSFILVLWFIKLWKLMKSILQLALPAAFNDVWYCPWILGLWCLAVGTILALGLDPGMCRIWNSGILKCSLAIKLCGLVPVILASGYSIFFFCPSPEGEVQSASQSVLDKGVPGLGAALKPRMGILAAVRPRGARVADHLHTTMSCSCIGNSKGGRIMRGCVCTCKYLE